MRQGQRTARRVLAILVTVGALLAWGCAQQGQQAAATAEEVHNRSFTFASGVVFPSALTKVSTTLAFTNNVTTFTLSASGGSATGTNVCGSCTMTVTTTAYPAGKGPQVDDVM